MVEITVEIIVDVTVSENIYSERRTVHRKVNGMEKRTFFKSQNSRARALTQSPDQRLAFLAKLTF